MCSSRSNGQILPFQGQKWTKKVKRAFFQGQKWLTRAFPSTEMAKMCLSKDRTGQSVHFQGQKQQMKGNKGAKRQKLQNAAGHGADKICLNFIRKRTVFSNLWGPHVAAQRSKKWKEMKGKWKEMKGHEGPKNQNERKWRFKRSKWKETKAQKAKMKRNKGLKNQNERKSKPKRPE